MAWNRHRLIIYGIWWMFKTKHPLKIWGLQVWLLDAHVGQVWEFIIRTTSNQLTQNSPKTTWQRIKGNNLNLNVNAMNHVDLWWFMCFYIKDKSYVQSNDLWKELPWIFPEPGDTNLKRVTYLVLDEAPHSFTRREVRSFWWFWWCQFWSID